MKELSIEEKAKRYDEALKKAKDFIPDGGYSEKELNLAFFMFIKGYYQAEKDLELTWEDIRRIYLTVNSTINNVGMNNLTDKSIYQEVLKRYKDFKERKEK